MENQEISNTKPEKEITNLKTLKGKNSKEEILHFIEAFKESFSPKFGVCAQTGNPVVTYLLDDKQFTRFLEKKDFQHLMVKMLMDFGYCGDLMQASERVVNILVGEAIATEQKFQLERRIGRHDEKIFINLTDEKGQFVEISKDGVKIVNRSPIYFLTAPKDLPIPMYLDCSPEELLKIWNGLHNFKDQDSSYLALAFIIKAMIPNSGANPILVLEGVQGAGKTTLAMVFKKLVDPTHPAVFSPPKTEKDFLIMANATYLMVMDNSSGLSAELSDVFCRASTGGGISLRVLYETDEERIYNLCKPIIVNGIEELTDRADFVERALILYLLQLNSDSRISEAHFWENFNLIYPKLIGGLYNLISQVLNYLPNIQTTNLVRMTEFNRVGLALDKAFKYPEGHFSNILNDHQAQKLTTIFDNDLFCQLIHEYLQKFGDVEGSAGQLMKKIFRSKVDKVSGHVLPRDPRRFKGKLQRLKPVLAANGIEWGELDRTANCRGLYIRFAKDPLKEL